MCEPKRDVLEQKLDHIKRDYDTMVSGLLHQSDRVIRIRTWNVAILVAYLGYIGSSHCSLSVILLLPIIGAVGLFWIMEGFEKAKNILLGLYLSNVDRLFAIKEEGKEDEEKEKSWEKEKEEFWNRVQEYRFRRTQDKPCASERPIEKKWSWTLLMFWDQSKRHRLKNLWKDEYSVPRRFIKGLLNAQAVVFYGVQFLLLLVLVIVLLVMGRCFPSVNAEGASSITALSFDVSDIRPSTPTAREPFVLKPAPAKRPPIEHKSTPTQ